MNMRRRVGSLEMKCPGMRRCRNCGGQGVGAVVVVRNAGDHGKPRGCFRCGAVGIVKRIVLLPLENAA
jgi:hypothetical protein